MIEETGLGDEAMETGFVLEIRSKRPPSGGRGLWTELDLLFQRAGGAQDEARVAQSLARWELDLAKELSDVTSGQSLA